MINTMTVEAIREDDDEDEGIFMIVNRFTKFYEQDTGLLIFELVIK